MKWKSQFDRMLRGLSKVEEDAADPDANPTLQLDNLYHFFQDCWHLKDWLRNDDDPPSESARKQIAKDAETTETLEYCAALARGSKHLKPDRTRRKATMWRFDVTQKDSDRSTLTVAKQLADDEVPAREKHIDGDVLSTTSHYIVASLPPRHPFGSTVGLARRAVQDWKDLLKKHGVGAIE